MTNQSERNKKIWIGVGVVLMIAFIYTLTPSRSKSEGATFTAIKGTMSIDVLEGGTIEATQAQIIKCGSVDSEAEMRMQRDMDYLASDELGGR